MASATPSLLDRTGMNFADERIALACAFRWTAPLDMHEPVANHFSLAVNDAGTKFLMNPRGRHFSRIKASEFLLLDAEDEATAKTAQQWSDYPDPSENHFRELQEILDPDDPSWRG